MHSGRDDYAYEIDPAGKIPVVRKDRRSDSSRDLSRPDRIRIGNSHQFDFRKRSILFRMKFAQVTDPNNCSTNTFHFVQIPLFVPSMNSRTWSLWGDCFTRFLIRTTASGNFRPESTMVLYIVLISLMRSSLKPFLFNPIRFSPLSFAARRSSDVAIV